MNALGIQKIHYKKNTIDFLKNILKQFKNKILYNVIIYNGA